MSPNFHNRRFFCLVMAIMLSGIPGAVYGGDGVSFTQQDRERMIRIEERLNMMDKRFEMIDRRFEELREDMNRRFEQVDKRFEQVDKRFEQIDKRFEQIDRRFEQVDKRFEQVDKRFETFQVFLVATIATFGALVAAVIGFAIWDRRTMIRPFESRVKKIDARIDRNASECDRRIDQMVSVLKELAKTDERVASILRSFSIL